MDININGNRIRVSGASSSVSVVNGRVYINGVEHGTADVG